MISPQPPHRTRVALGKASCPTIDRHVTLRAKGAPDMINFVAKQCPRLRADHWPAIGASQARPRASPCALTSSTVNGERTRRDSCRAVGAASRAVGKCLPPS